jgi:hypothetical protein
VSTSKTMAVCLYQCQYHQAIAILSTCWMDPNPKTLDNCDSFDMLDEAFDNQSHDDCTHMPVLKRTVPPAPYRATSDLKPQTPQTIAHEVKRLARSEITVHSAPKPQSPNAAKHCPWGKKTRLLQNNSPQRIHTRSHLTRKSGRALGGDRVRHVAVDDVGVRDRAPHCETGGKEHDDPKNRISQDLSSVGNLTALCPDWGDKGCSSAHKTTAAFQKKS